MLNNKRQYIYSYDYKNTRLIAKQERAPWGGNITENYTETNLYYYHKNHINSVVAITGNLGNILEEYEYDVF
jgi:hypothetical protein